MPQRCSPDGDVFVWVSQSGQRADQPAARYLRQRCRASRSSHRYRFLFQATAFLSGDIARARSALLCSPADLLPSRPRTDLLTPPLQMVFSRLPSDSNRARGKLYMPTECSFYTRTAHVSRLLVVALVPDASYRRAQRLQPAKLLKK